MLDAQLLLFLLRQPLSLTALIFNDSLGITLCILQTSQFNENFVNTEGTRTLICRMSLPVIKYTLTCERGETWVQLKKRL